jgi:glycosyltransferase involved in cell wall biosynthesis
MSDRNVLVSVIMPTYNQSDYIKNSINSVLEQTFKNFELIIIDNYSNDSTFEIISKYNDERIKYYKFENNGVIGASRNYGIAKSSAKYIAFLDSDDIWHSEKLEYCIKYLKNNSMICHPLIWVKNKKIIIRKNIKNQIGFWDLFYNGNIIATSSVIILKDLIQRAGGFSENKEFISAEDYHLWLRVIFENKKFCYINKFLGEYNFHNSNTSNKILNHMEAVKAVLCDIRSKYKIRGFINNLLWERRLSIVKYTTARAYQDDDRYIKSIIWYLRSIVNWPFFIKSYIGLLLCLFKKKPRW